MHFCAMPAGREQRGLRAAPVPGLRLLEADAPARRREVEAFVRRRFAEMHGAQVSRFMPRLWSLAGEFTGVVGAVGLRDARDGALYLERYLDEPVEQAIGRCLGATPRREGLVEVGNLAADGIGHARVLIVQLTRLLAAAGTRWVSFTGTPSLVNSFRRLGLCPIDLGPADPARLDRAERAAWARYYDDGPRVMAGPVPTGYAQLLAAGAMPASGTGLPDAGRQDGDDAGH
jgi:hypothetical protein